MSTNAAAGIVLPSYDNTLGAVLIGGFVSVLCVLVFPLSALSDVRFVSDFVRCALQSLYGVTCLQALIYYQRYPGDRGSVKYTVRPMSYVLRLFYSFSVFSLYTSMHAAYIVIPNPSPQCQWHTLPQYTKTAHLLTCRSF